jgi:prephenate dehydrogenase
MLLNRRVISQKMAILGVGLLGGSLGLAAKERGLAKKVVGYVRRESSIEDCLRAGAVDEATTNLGEAVENADIVIMCTPVGQLRLLTERVVSYLAKGALVTDVGSVKGSVVAQLTPMIGRTNATFVGSHPMAGSDQSGVHASTESLFEGAVCAVTPSETTPTDASDRIEALWKSVGGQPISMSPEDHDIMVARSSHLPHIAAAALARYVLDPSHPELQRKLCATGFRDTTRIASGSPEMWRDILLNNKINVLNEIHAMERELNLLRAAIAADDNSGILSFFTDAKQRKDALDFAD